MKFSSKPDYVRDYPRLLYLSTAMATAKAMMTPRALSGGRTFAHGSVARIDGATDSSLSPQTKQLDTYSGTTPYLNDLPDGTRLSYLPLPFPLKVSISALSTLMGIVCSGMKMSLKQTDIVVAWTKRRVVVTVLLSMSVHLLSSMAVQDLFYGPSRISSASSKPILPSSLSLLDDGVHRLVYDWKDDGTALTDNFVENDEMQKHIHIIHLNHGFGASSLSWLPVMPHLLKVSTPSFLLFNQTQTEVKMVAHDAPGFGFTSTRAASSANAAANVGLLTLPLSLRSKNGLHSTSSSYTVDLYGHSMGCATALRMAYMLPSNVRKKIILVSPALFLRRSHLQKKDRKGRLWLAVSMLSRYPRNLFFLLTKVTILFLNMICNLPLRYVLRRMVGDESFWKEGLGYAWGNPNGVTSDTLLRYRWPSVRPGWEKGILQFVLSQLLILLETALVGTRLHGNIKDHSAPPSLSTEQILQQLTSDPNVASISILHGTKDRVVPISNSQMITSRYPSVQLVPMEGMGHNPFEEDVRSFANSVKEILDDVTASMSEVT